MKAPLAIFVIVAVGASALSIGYSLGKRKYFNIEAHQISCTEFQLPKHMSISLSDEPLEGESLPREWRFVNEGDWPVVIYPRQIGGVTLKKGDAYQTAGWVGNSSDDLPNWVGDLHFGSQIRGVVTTSKPEVKDGN